MVRVTKAAIIAILTAFAGCQSDKRPPIEVRGKGNVNMIVPFQISSPQEMRSFLENRWSLERIRNCCVPYRILPFGHQNLTPRPGATGQWTFELHADVKHEFDRIYWFGFVKDGTIVASSMNVVKGDTHWVLEQTDPGDFDVKLPSDYPYITPQE